MRSGGRLLLFLLNFFPAVIDKEEEEEVEEVKVIMSMD